MDLLFYFKGKSMDIKRRDKQENLNNEHKGKVAESAKERRDALCQQIRSEGIDSLGESELLEYLLFFVNPTRKLNGNENLLIESFIGLAGVLDAAENDLCKFEGITNTTALFLTIIVPIAKKINSRKFELGNSILVYNEREIKNRLITLVGNNKNETLCALCYDSQMNLLSEETIERIVETKEQFRAKLFKKLLEVDCAYVVVGFNPQDGFTNYNQEIFDRALIFLNNSEILGIKVLDLFIYNQSDMESVIAKAKDIIWRNMPATITEIEIAKHQFPLDEHIFTTNKS